MAPKSPLDDSKIAAPATYNGGARADAAYTTGMPGEPDKVQSGQVEHRLAAKKIRPPVSAIQLGETVRQSRGDRRMVRGVAGLDVPPIDPSLQGAGASARPAEKAARPKFRNKKTRQLGILPKRQLGNQVHIIEAHRQRIAQASMANEPPAGTASPDAGAALSPAKKAGLVLAAGAAAAVTAYGLKRFHDSIQVSPRAVLSADSKLGQGTLPPSVISAKGVKTDSVNRNPDRRTGERQDRDRNQSRA